jgi:PAS domain S-box-containing protein
MTFSIGLGDDAHSAYTWDVASAGAGTGFADTGNIKRVEHAVARILAERDRPVEVYEAVLQVVGSSLGWELGAVWEAAPGDGLLRCVCTWHAGGGFSEFEALSEHTTLAPGEGLPGMVVESGDPAWIVDPPESSNFPRAAIARRCGLHAAFGFPLLSPKGVVGMMEFFTQELRQPDEHLLETMRELGSQVGQYVARRLAEDAVRASESQLRAMFEAALDAVVTMDHTGCITGWNHAAETTFGYRADEVLGRELADTIVPPSLREGHRRGLARFLETEDGVILDRRIELTALHKNGTEFPVELTVTRIAIPGPPMFTGYLRDIGDRKRAEAELRASRARLVEVADDERRRIQRNLHDGAQQRITTVLLNLGRLRQSPLGHAELIDSAIEELSAGLQEIRELARGLHPSVLAERGLVKAVEALAMRASIPTDVQAGVRSRLPDQVEAAAYYVVSEGLANAYKHGGAEKVTIRLHTRSEVLTVEVLDDGIGGADEEGSGLRGLEDRIEALGGSVALESPPGRGTRLLARLPLL